MGFNLPFHEVVLKERAEKGPAWFITDNSFYRSLYFNQQMTIPSMAGPSMNPGYTVPKKEPSAEPSEESTEETAKESA